MTGSARGIGLELVRLYLAAGAQVWATVRSTDDAKRLEVLGAAAPVVDVTDARSVDHLATLISDRAIDLLINNAGVLGPERQSTSDMDFEGFADVLAVNTLGPLRVTQALLPALLRSGEATVAVVTSRMGSLSYAKSDTVAYRASKAAANKVTQCLATDLEPRGVVVAAVHPGWVRTNIGGQEADIDPVTSARGIVQVLQGLTMKDTGRFWNYDGAALAW
ncbi:MAG: SDR family oxidoreductase [Mycobacteriales bacterium]|nr:SDR family oxidoreductase [Mycobacteriales bacterium]